MIFAVAAFALLIALTLAIVRVLLGPTTLDRALAVGTSAILFLSVLGFLTGRPEFLDVGILYALLNIIATLAVLDDDLVMFESRCADLRRFDPAVQAIRLISCRSVSLQKTTRCRNAFAHQLQMSNNRRQQYQHGVRLCHCSSSLSCRSSVPCFRA